MEFFCIPTKKMIFISEMAASESQYSPENGEFVQKFKVKILYANSLANVR